MTDINKAVTDRTSGNLYEIQVDGVKGIYDYEVLFIYWTDRGTRIVIPLSVDIAEKTVNVASTGPMPAAVYQGFQQAIQYAHDLAVGIVTIVK